MKRYSLPALMVGLLASPTIAADVSPRTPPSRPPAHLTLPPDFEQPDELPPEEPPPIECDLKASPDYVPGVDVKGRAVAPADVPTGSQVEIDTQVYVETRPGNRSLPRTGVIVNLPDLGAPACVPLEEKLPK